ncbi:DUF5666 domain-containing protein [Leifsonia xyli]|uniref:DUF5666 domain-containing protein n=1 Tax=Leifsonia xyli TaxID=1575 RepID=UPI003D677693
MSNTQPTEPIPPRQEPPVPPAAAAGPAPVAEPFYKRHGLAFAISTLVLSIVVLIGIFAAGAFAVAGVVSRVGERMISHSVPHQVQPGAPGLQGGPGNGGGKGDGGKGGGLQQGQALVRGTIASISGDTWTIDRQNGASVDVKVTTSTVYGTPGQSSSKSDFAAGDEVVVIGSRTDGTLTAKRILKLDSFPTRPPSTPGPATPGS